MAQQMLAQPQPRPRRHQRRLSDWSPTVELLTMICDRIGELTQAVAALGGAKPRKIPRGPYPVTASDRVRHKERITKHQDLVSRVLRRPPQQQQQEPDARG